MDRPLVFIHGAGDSARIWRSQVEYFMREGSKSVLAIDLPGHGLRPDIFQLEVTVQEYARAMREIVERELQLERPIIVGHSLGGAIAQVMAIEHGDELGGLILIGSGARLRVSPMLLEAARQNTETGHAPPLETAMTAENMEAIEPKLVAEQDALAPSLLYRDLMACNIFDVMKRLYEIQLPTLIICGEEDHMTPVKFSEYLHAQITGSTLRIIPQAGHYVMREKPDEVNRAIEEWMNLIGL